MKQGTIKRIHINRGRLDSNRKHGRNEPVITVKSSKGNDYANRVDILSEDGEVLASVIYSPDHPLSCGARAWIETRAEVRLVPHE